MFKKLVPQEIDFFSPFNALAEQVVLGSQALLKMLSAREESVEAAGQYFNDVDAVRRKTDEIARETMRELHKSFITPIERDDIHQLVMGMDRIMHLVRDAAHGVSLYNVEHVTSEALRLGQLGVSATEQVRNAVRMLNSMDNGPAILACCTQIGVIESQADQVKRAAMSRLFVEENDMRELVKYKAVYELLESVTDRCKEVASIVEGVVLENS